MNRDWSVELEDRPSVHGVAVYVRDDMGRYFTLTESPAPPITANSERTEALLIVSPELIPEIAACLRAIAEALEAL